MEQYIQYFQLYIFNTIEHSLTTHITSVLVATEVIISSTSL